MNELYVSARLRVEKKRLVYLRRHFPAGKNWSFQHLSLNQEVYPADILAEGEISAGFYTVHLAAKLNLPPWQAQTFLKRKIGQTIYRGELLASREELFGLKKTILLSPIDGIIDFYDERKGDLRILIYPKRAKLISGVYGIIEKLSLEENSVVIRTLVDLVYGVSGSGRRREGFLAVLGSSETLVSSRQISGDLEKHIVVGGGFVFKDALEKAINANIQGIVSGGINAGDFRKLNGGHLLGPASKWADSGLTLLLTEGFGSVPIGADIFAVLKEHQDQFAILDGHQALLILPTADQNSMIYIRSSKLPVAADLEERNKLQEARLIRGQILRLIAGPYLGYQGSLEEIDQSPTLLPSGIRTFLITVNIASRKIRLPYTNVEVIG